MRRTTREFSQFMIVYPSSIILLLQLFPHVWDIEIWRSSIFDWRFECQLNLLDDMPRFSDRYRRTSLIDQSDLKPVNKLHEFVFSFDFTRVRQICLNIHSILDLQMDENQRQPNLNSDFHALFMSSSSCSDVRNIWMKDVSMGKCSLSIPRRAFQFIFTFRFPKKSSWNVFVVGVIHSLK